MTDLAVLHRELYRSVLRDSFAEFVRRFWPVVTGNAYRPNKITEAIIAALQQVGDGAISKLILSCPPGCGKSTLLTLFHGWRLARDPSWKALTASHAYELAATTSRRVRRLVESPEFQAYFAVRLREDESTVAHWATTKDGRFLAVGREAGVTGRRVSEIVCDDLGAAADRHSKAALDHSWAFFAETLVTRLDNDRASQIVCGQRIAVDDVPGRLLALGGWTIVAIPAEDEHGNPNAPEVLPREKLDDVKRQIGALAYACQYLGAPADDSAAIIRRSWWRFHRPRHVPEHTPRPAGCDTGVPAVLTPESFGRVVVAADLTFGSLTGDYAVAQAWGAVGGARYLLEQWRAKAGFEDQIAAIEAMARRYPGCKVLVEKAANGAAVIETLRARIAGVIALKPRGSKQARLSAIAPAVESGSCLLPLGAPWLVDFVEELAGATKHDDAADTCAYAVAEMANRTPDATTLGLVLGGSVDDVMPSSSDGFDGCCYGGSVDIPDTSYSVDYRWRR